jgi:hypothetical protein
MGAKFLYGASVQGIQSFIFQTSKLTEIVGASELVEHICTSFFEKQVGSSFNSENLILGAAGNIKYLFDDKESCQELVKKFPRAVMEMAPGITISQAVVEIKGNDSNTTQLLENRLRIQRNKSISVTDGVGLMVMETARKTGAPGVDRNKDQEVIDHAQKLKNKAADKANKKLISKIVGSNDSSSIDKFPFDLSDMLGGDENKTWIAVIHADGNNLGQLIIQLTKNLTSDQSQRSIKNFSEILNNTTIQAAKFAFEKIISKKENANEKLPFRPVVLGGDDLTAIISADLALSYTKIFLQSFEDISKHNFKNFGKDNQLDSNPFENGLTACAGIAFIKASYPFHYAVNLAESLCKEAKNISKKINSTQTPSSLLFHKVHASFVEEYDDIIETELTAKDNIQFNYGPYFLNTQEEYATIGNLEDWIYSINQRNAPKAGLRNWLTALKNNPENANQLLERIASLKENHKYVKSLLLGTPFTERFVEKKDQKIPIKYTPIFDIISLSNILKNKIHE